MDNFLMLMIFIVSDREMLRVWEDFSVMYQKDHTADRSHEYIEVSITNYCVSPIIRLCLQLKNGEILIYVNMDVLIWIQYRKFNKTPELKREGDYIIATSNDRKDIESFHQLPFYSCYPIIATPLLLKCMKYKYIPITVVEEFGHKYVTSMPASEFAFNELCEWAKEEIDGSISMYIRKCVH